MKKGALVWFYQDYLEMFTGRPVETWLVKHALRWHRRALVVSTNSKEELSQYSRGDVRVVGVGLSHAEYFKPSADVQFPQHVNGQTNLLFLGDMRPRKGLFDFLAAARIVQATIPDLHLWMVSKEDCQIDSPVSYEYIYRPTRQHLADLYTRCDCFVSASWWESFGLPVLEGLACGAPMVITDSRGVRDFAEPGVNCLMVAPQNPSALAEALLKLLGDPALASQFHQAGPPAAAKFSWEACVERFEQALLD